MAAMGGFDKPILHGLCTYGISAKLVIQNYADGDPKRLNSINARFVGHVFPGETLVLHTWKDGNKVIFKGVTKERGKDVIVGLIELNEVAKPKLW